MARGDAVVREGEGHVGETVSFPTPGGQARLDVVRGVYHKHGDLDQLLGHIVLSQERSTQLPAAGRHADARAGRLDGGLERALAAFPDAKLQTGDEFIANWTAWLNDVMSLFYVLLALSVIVSLFGMVNTLVLAVFERTRELGMLRAVGMTRRQTRRMIRHESVITALIGARSASRSASASRPRDAVALRSTASRSRSRSGRSRSSRSSP